MASQITTCPECEATVVPTDNNVQLDVPSEPWSRDAGGPCWTVMRLGSLELACVSPDAGADGMGHRLHEHQPAES